VRGGRFPRLAVVSHSAVEESYRRKWELVAQSGWEVLLLVPPAWPEAGRMIRARPVSRGRLTVETVDGLWAGHVARWLPFQLFRRLSEFRPGLIHAEEEFFSLSCWAASRSARSLGVPFTFFTWENIRRRYRLLQEMMVPRLLSRASGALVGNRDGVRVLRNRGFRGPVAIVPQYGVDPREFRPRPRVACRRAMGWPVSGKVVGFVGRFVPEKGIGTLVFAVARLGPGVRLVLAGSGPMEAELRRMAVKLLPGRTIFQRPLPRSRMPILLGALDALVLPSRTTAVWKEQFGRVLAEAMACGRLVIGSSSGEIPAVISDPRLVFREGDGAGLAGKLDAMVMRGGARRLTARLRARALARYSEASVSSRTHLFLKSVVDSTHPRL